MLIRNLPLGSEAGANTERRDLKNASLPIGACTATEVHNQCTSSRDCVNVDDPGQNTTCEGNELVCMEGICQNGLPGGEWCGRWEAKTSVAKAVPLAQISRS